MRIADLLWGGAAGERWANSQKRKLERQAQSRKRK